MFRSRRTTCFRIEWRAHLKSTATGNVKINKHNCISKLFCLFKDMFHLSNNNSKYIHSLNENKWTESDPPYGLFPAIGLIGMQRRKLNRSLTKLWYCSLIACVTLLSSSASLTKLARNCWIYKVANRRVSNFDNLVSTGIPGNFVFNCENALDSTRIRARSRAFAALRSPGRWLRRLRDAGTEIVLLSEWQLA